MIETPYSKRKINMMRVNALRSEGSVAKNLFIAYLNGVHVLDFESKEAEIYPEDYYMFKRTLENLPHIEELHSQINTYTAVKILRLLGTSVDNKKLSFLTAHKDPFRSMLAQDVLDIVKADLSAYKILLDIFIFNQHRQGIRNVRSTIRKELGISNEEMNAYRIKATLPDSLKPLLNDYKKNKKVEEIANVEKPKS